MSTESQSLGDTGDLGRGPGILAGTWVCTILCIIAVSIRVHVRKKLLGLDDYLIVFVVMLQIASQSLLTAQYSWGFGKHDKFLSFDPQIVTILKLQWISSLPNILISVIARVSVVITLINIFGRKLWLKYFLISFTTLQTLAAIETILVIWLQASPVEGLWNPLIPARRWDSRVVGYSAIFVQSLFSFSDLTYVLFPLIIIYKLQMPLSRKISLACLMGLSLFTMAASIMKTITSQSPPGQTEDVQYNASLSILWSTLEQSLVIIMSSVPALRTFVNLDFPLLHRLNSSLASLINKRKGTSKESGQFNEYSSTGYYDLEMAPATNSSRGHYIAKVFNDGPGSTQSRSDNHIRRTDELEVSHM